MSDADSNEKQKPVMGAMALRKTSKMGIAIGSFAAFGGFLYGYDTGYISGVKEMPFWLQQFGQLDPATNTYILTSGTASLVTSILSAGTFFGALVAYPIGDRLGRRLGIQVFLALFCLGVALQTGAPNLATFVIGRVFAGLGVGGTSCLVPMYQAEVSPRSIRGAIVSGYQWMITIGLLIAAVIVNATKDRMDASSYRIPIALQFLWAAILSIGLIILPESPRWLIMQGRDEDAQKSLAVLLSAPLSDPAVNEEFSNIAANLHAERALGATSYLDCFRSGSGRNGLRMWTGIGVQSLQQLTGINFIFYYGTTFFLNSGISNGFTITIITNVVNVIATVPGIYLVDKAGRRPLLIAGAVGMAVSQLIVAIIGSTISVENLAGQRVLIAFVCIFIAFFAATWGPLAWVVTSEIYPTNIRAKAMSMSTSANWLVNFAIGYATPYLVNTGAGNAGLQSNVFYIWGGCCVLCFFFTFFFVAETKGLSLEQVDILYRNSSMMKSNAYRQKILDEDIHDNTQEAYKEAGAAKYGSETVHTEDVKA